MNASIFTGVALTLSAACAAFAQTPSRPCGGPTATEIFQLRTECGKLAEEVRVWQEREQQLGDDANVYVSQTSNYDAQANRCYVEIERNTYWKLGKGEQQYHLTKTYTLYDGQSRQLLAEAEKYGLFPVDKPDWERGMFDIEAGMGHEIYLKAYRFILRQMLKGQ